MGELDPDPVPHVPAWFQNGFHGFLRPFLRRHFHAIGIERESRGHLHPDPQQPVIVYGNHPSWWDPLVAHYLNRQLFPERQFFAPIDATALQQYRVFSKLGFYGVQLNSTSGAASFLKQSKAILGSGGTAIWMTPEGRFCDVRDHSADLMPGLAHLCTRLSHGCVLPLALEYVFWEERLPVCLVRIGPGIQIAQPTPLSKDQWNQLLHQKLRENQRELAESAMSRSSDRFDNLLRGRAGAGFFYDTMRRVRGLLSGQPVRTQHGEQFK